MMLILKINEMTRNDMVKIAEASPAEMTAEMSEFLAELASTPSPPVTSLTCSMSCSMRWRRPLNPTDETRWCLVETPPGVLDNQMEK